MKVLIIGVLLAASPCVAQKPIRQTLNIGPKKIAYEVFGEDTQGPTLILLHGASGPAWCCIDNKQNSLTPLVAVCVKSDVPFGCHSRRESTVAFLHTNSKSYLCGLNGSLRIRPAFPSWILAPVEPDAKGWQQG